MDPRAYQSTLLSSIFSTQTEFTIGTSTQGVERARSSSWVGFKLICSSVVRLNPGETKNDEGRVIPLVGELFETLARQKRIRDERWPDCKWVFYRYGGKVKSFGRLGTKPAGELTSGIKERNRPTQIFHDLRRTGARNLVRAAVPERVVMAIGGWKTRSVFDRYNIVSEKDLHEAAGRLERHLAEKRQTRTKQGQKELSQSSSLVTH